MDPVLEINSESNKVEQEIKTEVKTNTNKNMEKNEDVSVDSAKDSLLLVDTKENAIVELAESAIDTTEESSSRSETIMDAFGIMGKGMFGIFLFMLVFLALILILNKLFNKKKQDK